MQNVSIRTIALSATLAASLLAPAAAQGFPPAPVVEFLERHCYDCHDDTTAKGDLNLLDLAYEPGDHANFEVWEKVFDRVESGEMPPEKEPRPEGASLAAFLTDLGGPLLAADQSDQAEKGRVNVRRLTRREYEHTIHDLLGIDPPLQQLLPEDAASHGFETVATGQQLSHYNLASYLEAADLALSEAFARALIGDEKYSAKFTPEQLGKRSRGNYRGPETRNGYSVSWPIRLQFYGRMPVTAAPVSGWYRVTLKEVHAINHEGGSVWGTLRSGECSSSAPLLHTIGNVEATKDKRDLTFEAWIQEDHILELKPGDVSRKAAPTGATGGTVSYEGRDLVKQGFQGIAVKEIRMERIYPNAPRSTVRGKLFAWMKEDEFAKLESKEERAPVLANTIRRFASTAFRRPVSDSQAKPYIDLAMAVLDEPGKESADALHAAYRAILCSPRFLTFVEEPGPLDDHALAARLSYALWCSMPDSELRKLAREGKLSDPKVFDEQVTRMLDDPKSERFVISFADQWLDLKLIDFTTPDQQRFRTFDTIVQDSMVAETRASLRDMIAENRHIKTLIDSDTTFLNERLARFYGLEDVKLGRAGGMQRVSLGDRARGGLVTQGAILKVTANGTTTSPIVRGIWVSERILGIEAPPPPADVPAVEPDIRGAVSIRDQLDKHRSSESCAACHVKIDPAGFALENFDPVGLWREQYGTKKTSAKVDPAGVTPEGEEFGGIGEWKRIYAAKPDLLTEAFAQQLLTYATGAPPRFSDREAIAKIVATAREEDYGMRTIIHAVLGSEVFKSK